MSKTDQQVTNPPPVAPQMPINVPKNPALNQQTHQNNNQINMPHQFCFPGMFFPNSIITINYNFGK